MNEQLVPFVAKFYFYNYWTIKSYVSEITLDMTNNNYFDGSVTVWQMYFKIILKLKQVLIAMI